MSGPDGGGGAPPAAGDGLGRLAERVLGGGAALVLFLLMLLAFVDVVGRDAFNWPVPGAFEVTEIMMAALIFLALPVVSRNDEHVVVDLLDALTPARLARVREVTMSLAGALVLGVIAWRTWTEASDLAGFNEVTEYLRLPVAPVVYMISVLSALAALVHLGNAWRHLRGAAAPPPGASAS